MLPGTDEFEAKFRYFENGVMRRYETTLMSHSFMGAIISAEKLLISRHPAAVMMSVELVHSERKKHSIPRLIFTNPKDPPTKKV